MLPQQPNSQNLTIDKLVKSIKNYKPTFLSLNCDKKTLLDNYNYILTDKARDRLDKLYTYISNGISVLIEGETGSSKTLSAEIICKQIFDIKLNQNPNIKESYIKFNLSAEVKINDLMQKFMGNKNSLSGLEIVDGPFLKAFKNGIPLILDEINLASEEVLQCIEEAIDSGEINMEISGIGNINCKKKEGFCLIATQNPNRDNYMNKRQHLSKSFLSHFQIIKFPPFEIEEIKEIAENLFKSFNNDKEGDEKDKKFISDLITFHKEWTSKEERKDEIACFTIREITATVKAYIDEGKKNAFKIVKVIYASRYKNDMKKQLLKLLGSFDSFKNDYEDYLKNGTKFQIPKEIEGFYENEILKEVIESSIFSLLKRRNIIIVGENGIGKSHISREVAKIYNLYNNKKGNSFYHFICTEETKCSDLIGGQVPKEFSENDIYMEWKDGFLTKAIEKGDIVILDNLQEANSTVTERLNGLLDNKYDENKKKGTSKKFDIPENPLKNSIEINKDFRIIGICDIQAINQMSPAFLNRFDVIVLENQLKILSEENIFDLLQIIINKGEEKTSLNENVDDILGSYLGLDNEDGENKEEKNKVEILDKKSMNYLVKKILNKKNNKNFDNSICTSLSLCDISRLCYSIKIFLKKNLEEFKDINKEHLIDFIYDLLFSENELKIKDEKIKNILLQLLNKKIEEYLKKEKEKNFNNFIFSKNESLENYLSIVYASFLINLHLCIIGPPGIGKTSSAKFISEILQTQDNNYKFFPFHRNTKISELYGTLNIRDQTMEHYNGPLIEAAQKGCIFIADEMNLSSIPTMKSIVPFLDQLLNKNLMVPGLEKPFDIHDNFFFIICQNDLDNLGRNCVPDILQRKIRNINYPKQTGEEIKNICKKKRIKDFGIGNEFSEIESELLGEFMRKYNEIIDSYNLPLLRWSFRDIDKIIRRISEHIRDTNYKNFKYFHFIYFYLLSPIPHDYFEKKFKNENLIDIIHSLFIKVFKIEKNSDELLFNYFNKPNADLNKNFIMKGNLGIKFDNLAKMLQEEQIFEEDLPYYYDDLFKLKLISKEEPVLLMGPSSYKTHLAKYFIKKINLRDSNIINLNQKTTIEELLGGPQVLPPNSYMFFYDLLKDITNYQEDDQNNIIEGLKNMQNRIRQFKSKTIKYKILKNLFYNMYNNIKSNKENEKDGNNIINKDNIIKKKNSLPQIEFKPGSILLSILKEESIIFKNVHEVSTEIFERFNELFGTERVLSLNEDIYGTLYKSNNPEYKLNNKSIDLRLIDNIYIFATCPENSFQSLSESITSRFSVICVKNHGIKEKEKIIRNYAKKCMIMPDLCLHKISEKIHKENFSSINKLKNLIDIFNEMNKNNINNNKELDKIYHNLDYAMHYINLNIKYHLYDVTNELIKNESPLKYENNFLISKISQLKIFSQKIDKNEYKNIVFTSVFNEMADLLHFVICTGTPLILEGSPGLGKQKVINYISDLLDYDVENIVITNDFSVNDLFKNIVLKSNENGEFEIESVDTKLNKVLSKSRSKFSKKLSGLSNRGSKSNIINEENEKQKPVIFVFHNIHKASADVLSKISSIFNKKSIGCNYFFIGLINIKESLIERSSYFNTYFYNSIYYVVDSTNIDISFYKQIYDDKDMELSVLKYFKNNGKKGDNNFTLTDFSKFVALKRCSHFDDSFLEEIILKNRYFINKINKGNNNMTNNISSINQFFDIDISYKNQNNELLLELNGKSISLESSEILKNFEKEKNCLSYEQKKALCALGLSVKSKLPIILEGPTGIGKSHLIKLFAKFLGKKIFIIELNKENDTSLLSKRYIYNKYDHKEEEDINTIIDGLIDNKEYIKNVSIEEKLKILNETKLDKKKKIKFDELKTKYKFTHRFKYEKSDFFRAVEEGEWILLDGIENAPSSIIEKVTLLCGDKPELNLYESGQKSIRPKEGFHLFMTYNPDRINHNENMSSILLDKCLIYNLDSFAINEKAISQIIYGFLINSNYSTNAELIMDISSRITNLHYKIIKELHNESEKISERTIINTCKNWNFQKEDATSFAKSLKDNFLYFYFPSSDINKFDKIINDYIGKKGTNFIPLAKNFSTECKESLYLLDLLEQSIKQNKNYHFNLGDFIFSCLNIPFNYLESLKNSINEVLSKAIDFNYNYIFLPINILIKYLDEIYNLYKIQNKNINNFIIRKIIDFPNIKILLLFEKLYKNNLLSWNCINILYENDNIFKIIKLLSEQQNLETLGIFLEELIANFNYINDIINIFPYSIFQETRFSLINEILMKIIKITSIKKINFQIKILDKEYNFKYTQNENDNLSIILDLNLNEDNQLIITKETKIILFSINKNKSIPSPKFEKHEYLKLNRYFIMLIEKIMDVHIIDKKSFKNIYREIIFKLDDIINPISITNFNLEMLFKNKNNLVTNIWSILFLNKEFDNYLEILLKSIEKNVFEIFVRIKTDILIESPENFDYKLDKIISLSKDLYSLLEDNSFIINLSKNENYVVNMKFNDIEERKKIQKKIKEEINNINYFTTKNNYFPYVNELFISYSELLENENRRLLNEIDKLEIYDFKERIANKIKLGLSSKKLIDKLLNDLRIMDTNEKLKEFDILIDNYIMNYNSQKKEKKISLFSEKDTSSNFLQENKNEKLIDLLLKYSKIKDIINDIYNNNNNKLISLEKLNDLIDLKHIDFFNCLLIKEEIKNKTIDDIYDYLNAMFVKEVIKNNMVQNLIEIKKLLNNLYEIDNYGKLTEIWCKNIEHKYNIINNIYMPELNKKSFLNLFIKAKNDEMEKEKGFLLELDIQNINEENSLILNSIFDTFRMTYQEIILKENYQLILSIGNIFINKFIMKGNFIPINDLNKMYKTIEIFIKKSNKNDILINILDNFLNAVELYLKYDNSEKLILDDINSSFNKKALFSDKYPSLINYLNCNQNIYQSLITEPKIYNFKTEINCIPLWLICLRALANTNNIKPFFEFTDNIIFRFENEFQNKLQKKLKNKYKDIYWILLISPNYNRIVSNDYYERIYKLFSYLLYKLTLLSPEKQNIFYEIIKNFIYILFDSAYDKGIKFILSKNIELFNLNIILSNQINECKNQKFTEFYNSNDMVTLKSFLNILINDKNKDSLKNLINKLKYDLNAFEKEYNFEYNKNLVELEFSNVVNICEKYNNLIDIYNNNIRTEEEINNLFEFKNKNIENLVVVKDAYFTKENYSIAKNNYFQKVEYIKKNEYIKKYIKNNTNYKFKYFTDKNLDIIERECMNLIEKLKEVNNIINSLNISNIHKLDTLNEIIKLIEGKKELFKINEQIDKFIIEKIFKNSNINIEVQIKNILLQLNKLIGLIKSIVNYLSSYEIDNDLVIIEHIKKELTIYFPKEEIFKKYKNNNNEYIISKDENNLIPSYFIENNKIIGCDEIKYELGTLNLNDTEIQNIYFAIFNNSITFKIIHKESDVDIIKRNKINIFQVKLQKKKKESIEEIKTEGSLKFQINKNGEHKIVHYQISYQLEPLKLYLKCDKYKLKYIGESTFFLNSPILFIDETIFFTIKNLSFDSENFGNNFKINFTSYEDNTCLKPIKNQEKEGFSLQIKSEPKSINDILSFLLTVIICKRFQFYIKIYSQVKLLDFDFLISRNIKEGFLNKQIYCPFEENNFNFILYVATSQKRLNKLSIETIYDKNLISMNEIKKIKFFNSIQIITNVKLLKKQETNIKLKASIDNKIKEILIFFDAKNKCKNFGYKIIDNIGKKKDDSEYFAFTFNEITAHGIEIDDKKNLTIDNIYRKKPGFVNLNKINNNQILQLNELDTHIDINIIGLSNFYNRISEEARLLPIYYLNYKNEKRNSKNLIILRKNYYILEDIYNCLDLYDDDEGVKFYEENYFFEEIKEFISSFNYMKSIIEIHDIEMDKLINKFQKYIEKNKDILEQSNESLKALSEKIKNFKKIKNLMDYMNKLGINLSDFEDNFDEIKNSNNEINIANEKEKQKLISFENNNNIIINEPNKIQNINNSDIKSKRNYSKKNKISDNKLKINNSDFKNDKNVEQINIKNNINNIIDKISFQDIKIENSLNSKNNKINIPSNNKDDYMKNNFDVNEDKNNYKEKEIENEEKQEVKKQENSISYIKEDYSKDLINNKEALSINNKKKSDDIIDNLINILKNENYIKSFSEDISKKNNKKSNAFLEKSQDIWKQNGKNKGVFTERNDINRDNYFDNYLNNQINFPTKIFSNQAKINSLEQVKKEMINRNQFKNNTINQI